MFMDGATFTNGSGTQAVVSGSGTTVTNLSLPSGPHARTKLRAPGVVEFNGLHAPSALYNVELPGKFLTTSWWVNHQKYKNFNAPKTVKGAVGPTVVRLGDNPLPGRKGLPVP
jgi:hypothetical protein